MTNLESIARKITGILFAQQSLASAGFIAAATLNSIVGKELSGHSDWAGVPSAVYLLAGAFAAFMWGYVFDLIGRRDGLTIGLGIGAVGSGIAFYAIAIHSFAIFLGGMVLMGIANAAVQLGRFAAAEVNPPEHRGRAISNVVIGGTVGSVIGPFVAGPAGNLIGSWGIDELAGAYLVSLVLFVIAAIVVFIGLRPDPREIGKQVAEKYPDTIVRSRVVRSMAQIFSQPAALVALTSMVLGQMVMVLVMVITSLHMRGHQHDLTDISLVISSHTFGMYAFSIISGRLADQWGRGPVIITGSLTLVIACIAATISPDVLPLGVALFLLGLGWNFCFVGGSTLLADQLSPDERARTQGFNDLLVGLASAIGSLSSGFIFAALGYNTMAFISAVFAVIPLLLASYWTLKRARKSRAIA
ncbi:MFS transporter [Candidatus Villigracilis affinis]|uniref:MFS transporter n=1 Tax=Candidatus Villigracilis affinis TaxID=3140682 RepID=UPI002A20E787|nr:MFS transporter [Anaerolineales bacterium]